MPSENISAWEKKRQKLRKAAIEAIEALLHHMDDPAAWTFQLGEHLEVTITVLAEETQEPPQPLNKCLRNRDKYRQRVKDLKAQGKSDEAARAQTQADYWAMEALRATEAQPAPAQPSKPARRTPSPWTRAKR